MERVPERPYPMGCEAVEAVFVFGAQRCMKRATGVLTCDDCPEYAGPHPHPICPEHGGPAYENDPAILTN